jgi:hypothetical protein
MWSLGTRMMARKLLSDLWAKGATVLVTPTTTLSTRRCEYRLQQL